MSMGNPQWKKCSQCCAKSRTTGERCRHVGLKQNSRCYYHQGRQPIKHGRYTKSAKAERTAQRKLITKVRKQTNDIKKKVSEEVS